ncbi:hypothetical protein M378DRAFT_172256, partial [Amanita muscaria Koide BX008]
LYGHLNELDVDLAAICFSWFLSLFTDCLPVEKQQELLRCESIPALYVALENLPTRMWEADRILQVGVFRFFCDGLEAEFRNILLHTDLVNRQNTHVEHLKQLTSLS